MSKKQLIFIFLIFLFLCFIFGRIQVILKLQREYEFKDFIKKDYTIKDDFLKEQELQTLKNEISKIPLDENPLSYGFKNSKGKVLFFSIFDMDETFKRFNIEFLLPYIKSIKNPVANHFIFNILEITPLNIKDKKWFTNPLCVNMHYDNTLSGYIDIPLMKEPLPICVNVFYLDCPKKITKGRLILNDFYNLRNICKVESKQNRMLEFKGNLYHGVETMFNLDENDTTKRISLVLEQYVI